MLKIRLDDDLAIGLSASAIEPKMPI